MFRTVLRVLLPILLGWGLHSVAVAQAPLCPTPLPFANNSATTISPINPTDAGPVLFWVVTPGFYELENYTVNRQGQTIYMSTYQVTALFFPGEPGRCRTVPLGTLPAGTYTIVWTLYQRDIDNPSYPTSPTLGPTPIPSFTVTASALTVTPTVPALGANALISLIVLMSGFAVIRLRRRG